ncbi:MAG: helix-turn-helix domain-containing protein, partial [Clostridia bacterium]|nr:helix-turn-helix domain-containing protein [Clostridia bacterium]
YPTVKTVILTGFDDFKFAQAAIKHGVTDYILKPVLPKDINELLEKLRKRIDSEIAARENMDKLVSHYYESLPLMKENYLTSLILGKPGSGRTVSRIRDMNIRLEGRWYASAICKIDSESIPESGFSDEELELKRFAVLNIINEILDGRKTGEAMMHDDGIVILLESSDSERSTASNKMLSILELVRQSVCKYMSVTVSIGLGKLVPELIKLRDSYLSSITARNYKVILSGNKVIFVEDLEPGINNFFHIEVEKEDALISSIKFKEEKDIAEAVSDLFRGLDDSGASLEEYKLYYTEIVSSLLKLARLFSIEPSEVFPKDADRPLEFMRFNSIGDVKSWIYKLSVNLRISIAGKRSDASEILFEKALKYIGENFEDPELNIQKLAKHLFISSSYLSLLFKKQSGKTFLRYLVGIRLAKAKDLLQDKSIKIASVAEKVGYPDVSYFSYFFKKNTGVSPREFRKGDKGGIG